MNKRETVLKKCICALYHSGQCLEMVARAESQLVNQLGRETENRVVELLEAANAHADLLKTKIREAMNEIR